MNEYPILNNRYRLEERIGSGGMAMVYRARDLTLDRTVGIKILKRNFSKEPGFRERFRQEARSAARLSHPNIATVHDFGFDGDQLFMIMEYVPGTDLKSILQQHGPFGVDETLFLALQACAGIGYAHRSGLVHCDVKPQNMLVTPEGWLKVVDFGIARALVSIRPDEKHRVVWGSPQYYSPEQAAGDPPSPASDVYSLGIILFELLTGQLPFVSTSVEELGRMHREDLPPSVRRINPNVPPALEQVLLDAMAKDPARRYPVADELGSALSVFLPAGQAFAQPNPAWNPIQPAPTWAAAPLEENPEFSTPATGTPRQAQPPAEERIDWLTWALALFALIAVGGLIPFWLWIYYVFFPPL